MGTEQRRQKCHERTYHCCDFPWSSLMDLSNELLTREELERYLRISRSSTARMLADQKLPAYVVGRRSLRFRLSEVMAALSVGKHE